MSDVRAADRAKILIGVKWWPCTVERIDDIPYFAGRAIRRFTCRMDNGDLICCGRNSIRKRKEFR